MQTAYHSRDARYDGHFFVGVLPSKVYCRNICKSPQPQNTDEIIYFSCAAEAERLDFAPCLECRPELAPGISINAQRTKAYLVARYLEDNCNQELCGDSTALALGLTPSQIDDFLKSKYKVTSKQYLLTCRLHLAKRLLTETGLTLCEIAKATGLRTEDDLYLLLTPKYRLSPSLFQKERKNTHVSEEDITLLLPFRPPYLWGRMINFLQIRKIKGVESVENDTYSRTVCLNDFEGNTHTGILKVKNNPTLNMLSLTVNKSLLPVLPQVLSKINTLFDLRADPLPIYDVLSSMNEVYPELCLAGTRVPGNFDPFEMIIRAVLGQQITVKAAGTLAGRVALKFGTPIPNGTETLSVLTPTPETIVSLGDDVENQFGNIGVIATRSNTIKTIASHLVSKEINFGPSLYPEQDIKKLRSIRGIGHWTANYIAMRALEWSDAFLETDYGIKKVFAPRKPKEILQLAEQWRPWRSYATICTWNFR